MEKPACIKTLLLKLLVILVVLFNVFVKGLRHAGAGLSRSFYIQSKPIVLNRFGSIIAKGGNGNVLLVKARKIIEQRLYSARAIEYQHVVVQLLKVGQVAANGTVKDALGILYFCLIECFGYFGLVNIR